MNKLNMLFLFIIFNAHSLHCMKRIQKQRTINSPAKRQKTNNALVAQSSLPSSPVNNNLSVQYSRLYCAVQEHSNTFTQMNYIRAIEQRNTNDLAYWLACGPMTCCLESIVGLNFTEGVYTVLKYAQPTQPTLNESLQIAIRKQNILIVDALLARGAQLETTNTIHPMTPKALNENKIIFDLMTQHSTNLIGAVSAGLEDVVKAILKKTKPRQLQLNESLHIAALQQNVTLATLLIEAGASVESCIK